MDALEMIKGRRSIREYKADPVDREVIGKIVEAASYAPSWKNTQTARYYVIDDRDTKKYIADLCTLGFSYNTETINQAPQIVIVSAINGRSGVEKDGSYTTSKKEDWKVFDSGIATQTFCLAAYAYGVSTVIMGVFDPDLVAERIHLPENQTVTALIAMGYADQEVKAPPRKDVGTLLTFL